MYSVFLTEPVRSGQRRVHGPFSCFNSLLTASARLAYEGWLEQGIKLCCDSGCEVFVAIERSARADLARMFRIVCLVKSKGNNQRRHAGQ